MNNLNHEERFAQEVVERGGGGVEQQHVEAQPIPSWSQSKDDDESDEDFFVKLKFHKGSEGQKKVGTSMSLKWPCLTDGNFRKGFRLFGFSTSKWLSRLQ